MEIKIGKLDWIFLLLCLIAGVVAEESFFRGQIGLSFFIFIFAFYMLVFWRFRAFSFSHQRLGYFVLIVIWLLSAGYYLYDVMLFYVLNILVIPALVIFHLALITAPKNMEWNRLFFIGYMLKRLIDSIVFNAKFASHATKLFANSNKSAQHEAWKKVLIGIAISIPVLFVVLQLLISADAQFERLIGMLPELINFSPEYFIRFIIILFCTFGFFGYLQVLLQRKIQIHPREESSVTLDGIITLTVLFLLNLVYLLFIVVQFKYFFNGALADGYTYAEYARRGFFELLFVTLINLTVTTIVITFTKNLIGALKKVMKLALSVLVLASGVLLVSAFMRMNLYEEAYGYTFTRVLVVSFMIFLMVILAYTLVKIWLEKLSLFHFYFIATLIYYAGINMVNLNQVVVDKNIARYEETGKIDIYYFDSLSATGTLGLIELYEKHPTIPGIESTLQQRKIDRASLKGDSWQSQNLTRNRAYERLGELDL